MCVDVVACQEFCTDTFLTDALLGCRPLGIFGKKAKAKAAEEGSATTSAGEKRLADTMAGYEPCTNCHTFCARGYRPFLDRVTLARVMQRRLHSNAFDFRLLCMRRSHSKA